LIERDICPDALVRLGWRAVFVFVAIEPLHVEAKEKQK
jgi:hypothetical protein